MLFREVDRPAHWAPASTARIAAPAPAATPRPTHKKQTNL